MALGNSYLALTSVTPSTTNVLVHGSGIRQRESQQTNARERETPGKLKSKIEDIEEVFGND
jgi:hypothetical protein